MAGTWWWDFVQWEWWAWTGWPALGAIGTVGALAFLAIQDWLLRKQIRQEREERRADERARTHELEQAQTPFVSYLSTNGFTRASGSGNLWVYAQAHIDFPGVVLGLETSLLEEGGKHITTPEPIALIHSPDTADVAFELPSSYFTKLPVAIELRAKYQNRFGQTVQLTHQGTVDTKGLSLSTVATYEWPWVTAVATDEPAGRQRHLGRVRSKLGR